MSQSDQIMTLIFGALIGLFVLMFVIGIPRGRRTQHTNERIAANQERALAIADRHAKVPERIADAVEER